MFLNQNQCGGESGDARVPRQGLAVDIPLPKTHAETHLHPQHLRTSHLRRLDIESVIFVARVRTSDRLRVVTGAFCSVGTGSDLEPFLHFYIGTTSLFATESEGHRRRIVSCTPLFMINLILQRKSVRFRKGLPSRTRGTPLVHDEQPGLILRPPDGNPSVPESYYHSTVYLRPSEATHSFSKPAVSLFCFANPRLDIQVNHWVGLALDDEAHYGRTC